MGKRGSTSQSIRWSTQLNCIPLRRSLELKITQTASGFIVRSPDFALIGDGNTIERALEMLFDKLFLDYYEFSLNPGVQGDDDRAYGVRIRKLFALHAEEDKPKRLLAFHS